MCKGENPIFLRMTRIYATSMKNGYLKINKKCAKSTYFFKKYTKKEGFSAKKCVTNGGKLKMFPLTKKP